MEVLLLQEAIAYLDLDQYQLLVVVMVLMHLFQLLVEQEDLVEAEYKVHQLQLHMELAQQQEHREEHQIQYHPQQVGVILEVVV